MDHLQRILLFIEDITEYRKAQAAIRATEIRYRRLFEAARDGILILDPDTRKITDANPFMTELLGYPHKKLVGKELWEIELLQDEKANRMAFHELKRKHFMGETQTTYWLASAVRQITCVGGNRGMKFPYWIALGNAPQSPLV